MPKDPKRNIQSYQIRGGDLNEFEFQKRQAAVAEEPVSTAERDTVNPTPAERVAEVTADAHAKVEERRRRGISKAAGSKRIAAGKNLGRKPVKKKAGKAGTKKTTRKSATKKAPRKSPTKNAVRKSATNKTARGGLKKRGGVKSKKRSTSR